MPSESEPFLRAVVQLWVKWIDEHVATKIFFKVREACAVLCCAAPCRCVALAALDVALPGRN